MLVTEKRRESGLTPGGPARCEVLISDRDNPVPALRAGPSSLSLPLDQGLEHFIHRLAIVDLATAPALQHRGYGIGKMPETDPPTRCCQFGPGGPRDCSPGAPTDPYVPSRAYGSSHHELATGRLPEGISNPSRTRRRDRCCCMYTVMGFDAPAMCSSNGVMTWRPLLSTGSLGMVPPLQRYYGTLRLPAVRLDPFEFFTSRYHRFARVLLPSVGGVPPGARELSVPVSPSGFTMETSGSLRFLGNPGGHCPCSSTPAGSGRLSGP